MSQPTSYQEGRFSFRFTPQDNPDQGTLITRLDGVPPYAAEVNLSKIRSRASYASDACETWGLEDAAAVATELKTALNALFVRRSEEAAAEEAQQEDTDPEEPEVDQEQIDERVGEPGVLNRFVEDAARISGVVGEQATLKLIALGAFSAQLALLPNGKPLGANIVLIGDPGRGKNFASDAIARLLPDEFFLAFESSSGKSLYYMAADNPACLKHRMLYANEAEAIDLLIETVRPLLSGARARHLTVASDTSGRNVGQEFVIEGPATVLICTVRNKLEGQLQSRLLVSGLEDFEGRVAAHSGAVSGLLSPGYATTDHGEEIRAWNAALRSLTRVRRVVVPVEHPEFRFGSDAVPHGARLWSNFLGLMCARAWLEQRNRRLVTLPSGETAVVATAEDYRAAYEVFRKTCERSVVNLSGAHRKILDAVHGLQTNLKDKEEGIPYSLGFSQRAIAQKAGVAQSTVSANRTFLIKSAKLLRETSEGRLLLVEDADPSIWREGDALDGFPRPGEVREWWGEDDLPSRSDHADRADQDLGDAHNPRKEAEDGDRPPADREAEALDRAPENLAEPGDDRRKDDNERAEPDRENGSSEADNPPEAPTIGAIGGSEAEEDYSEVGQDDDAQGEETNGRGTPLDDEYEEPVPLWLVDVPPPVDLKASGWSRKRSFANVSPEDRAKANLEIPWRLEADPAADEFWQVVDRGEGYAGTVGDLLRWVSNPHTKARREWLSSVPYPTTLGEMSEHLERLATAMQGDQKFQLWLETPEGTHLHAECWEKTGEEEIWVFVPASPEGPADEEIEDLVRKKAYIIELDRWRSRNQ